jgi:hypothetical protein
VERVSQSGYGILNLSYYSVCRFTAKLTRWRGREQYTEGKFLPETYDPTDDDPSGPRESWPLLQEAEGKEYVVTLHISPPQLLSALEDPGRWSISDVLVPIYALNNRESFDELRAALESASQSLSNKFDAGQRLFKVVMATHCDLPREEWKVSEEEGRELATLLGYDFRMTSALTGEGVKELIEDYVRKVIEMREEDLRKEEEEWLRRESAPPPDAGAAGAGWRSKTRAAIKRVLAKGK